MTPDDLQEWMKTDEAREKAEKWAEDFAAKHPELIEQEVPVYSFSSYQSDPQISRVQAASGVGDIATVQKILESWAGNKDCCGIALQPSLEDTYDDEKMLRWFLDHGADPNAEKVINGAKMGETPLSKAM
ncbi:MAG: hypothetical protein Q9177_006237 [Variospora cf. flavescens]